MAVFNNPAPCLCLVLGVTIVVVSGTQHFPQARSNLPTGTLQTSEVNHGDFEVFIPTTPLPENVNCYVEVNVLQTIGGQCVRFGRSSMWSCQSGVYVRLSPDCGTQNRRRGRTQRRPAVRRP